MSTVSSTPYVRRVRYFNQEPNKDRIALGERTFDGIETSYDSRFTLTPDEARYVGEELLKLAEQIDGHKKKKSVIGKIRKNTERIAKAAKREAMT